MIQKSSLPGQIPTVLEKFHMLSSLSELTWAFWYRKSLLSVSANDWVVEQLQ